MFSRAQSQSHVNSASGDPYFGHQAISQAVSKYIKSNPALQRRRSPSTGPLSAPLDLYVARIIHETQVPNIVPYTALYLLASVSRTCRCGKKSSPTSEFDDSSYDENCQGISKPPSTISHRLSRIMTRNPFSQLRRPRYTAHHFFIGSFLLVISQFQKNFDMTMLSQISGVRVEDMIDLHAVFTTCMDRDTALALGWMIKESEFRSLNDVECPVVVMRRKRLAQKEEQNCAENRPQLKRIFSMKSFRSRSSSLSSFESRLSTDSYIPLKEL
ncbi:hypothetical protein D9756_008236 [Leucocoprinus leucothites]|uniref:Uncharacterized protein n=1 Tax=Leucocoprinus leucothites TaxID=201217 RepID=A0A8H5CZR3_9AGAR|nr:hypothetical protein D9756_008236 [Leucoagaricus leucothites]